LLLAGLGVSAALASPPPGRGKDHATSPPTTTGTTTQADTKHGERDNRPARTGASCRPAVAVVLKGTLAADGSPAPFSLSLNVAGGNRAGRAYKAASQPVSIDVTSATRVNRRGQHDPALLKSGDRVVVQARPCKADLAGGATPPLTAARLTAKPPKPAKTDTTETTGTDTTETTTTTDSSGG
jgi:hypothetical protein